MGDFGKTCCDHLDLPQGFQEKPFNAAPAPLCLAYVHCGRLPSQGIAQPGKMADAQDDHHGHDVHFESADAGASLTYPQQAGTIRKNGFLVIKGRPCKVGLPAAIGAWLFQQAVRHTCPSWAVMLL